MYRLIAIIALLFSLFLLLWQLKAEPVYNLGITGEEPDNEKGGMVSFGRIDFYPPVPDVVPDLYDGYLFVEERKLEEDDFGPFGDTPAVVPDIAPDIDMEGVAYSGSVIIGEMRKALITYKEKSQPQPRRVGRGRAVPNKARASAEVLQYKQLELGEVFKGYMVAGIEEDRIVFEKGGEKVEKFLFDQNKKRVDIKAEPSSQAANTASAPVVPPPAAPSAPSGNAAPAVPQKTLAPPTNTKPGNAGKPAPVNRRLRRSQRLLNMDPSFVPPGAGGIPGQLPTR